MIHDSHCSQSVNYFKGASEKDKNWMKLTNIRTKIKKNKSMTKLKKSNEN